MAVAGEEQALQPLLRASIIATANLPLSGEGADLYSLPKVFSYPPSP